MLKCLIGSINPLSSPAERAIANLQVKHWGAKPQNIPRSERFATISKIMGDQKPQVGLTNFPAMTFFTEVAGPDVLAELIEQGRIDLTIAPQSRYLIHLRQETASKEWKQE
jgi:hypothetical protein